MRADCDPRACAKNTYKLLKNAPEINQAQGVALLEDLTKAMGANSKNAEP